MNRLGIETDPSCPFICLSQSSVDETSVNTVDEEETWMTPIINYLVKDELPSKKKRGSRIEKESGT